MEFMIQPWFLIAFAVVAFFVFHRLGTREKDKTEIAMMRLTRWVIVGISVVIVTLGVLKVLEDHHLHPFQPQSEVVPLTVR